jgi:hypothetical protein
MTLLLGQATHPRILHCRGAQMSAIPAMQSVKDQWCRGLPAIVTIEQPGPGTQGLGLGLIP